MMKIQLLLLSIALVSCVQERNTIEPLIENEDYLVRVTMEPEDPVVGETVSIQMNIKYEGKPLSRMEDLKVLHATVSSENLKDFDHYFPEIKTVGNGVFQFSHTIEQAGAYTLFLDIPDIHSRDHHEENVDYRGVYRFHVEGEEDKRRPRASTRNFAGVYETRMKDLGSRLEFHLVKNGRAFHFLQDADHYVAIYSPENDLYILDHIDISQTSGNVTRTKILDLERSGTYLVWMMNYIRDNGEYIDLPSWFVLEK